MIRNAHNARIPEFIKPILEISLIFLLITICGFDIEYISNEYDYVPFAKQFYEGNWIPNDWYLNLDISYRELFMFIFGGLISHLGFQNGLYIGRILIYLLLSCAIYDLFRTFRLRYSIGIIVLILFLHDQYVVAYEYIVTGLSNKTIAYAFVLFSAAAFYRKQFLIGFAFAGAAISFHILVGIYAGYCLFIASVLTGRFISEWREYLKNFWPVLITGSIGFVAIAEHLLSDSLNETTKAWEIYVQYRVPHHVLPSNWGKGIWILELLFSALLGLAVYFRTRSSASKFIAAYLLGSLSLFLIGLIIFATGEIHLLKYYWFRFPDVMLPFLNKLLLGLILCDFISGYIGISSFQDAQRLIRDKLKSLLLLTAAILTLISISFSVWTIINDYRSININNTGYTYNDAPVRKALLWIAENTPTDAVFLVDPFMMDFYVYAQRPMLVSFKHSPQSADDITEWYKRILVINNNQEPTKMSFQSKKELSTNFYNMSEKQIKEIAREYGVKYYLGLPDRDLPFKRIYQDPNYVLYEIDN